MYQNFMAIGNLGSEVELRYTPSGVAVASFSLAVNKTWNHEGERKSKTTWFRVSVWREQAETIAKFLHKGSKVMVVGEVEEARPYTDRDGKNRASLEVTANLVKFLSKTDDGKLTGEPLDAATSTLGDSEIPF